MKRNRIKRSKLKIKQLVEFAYKAGFEHGVEHGVAACFLEPKGVMRHVPDHLALYMKQVKRGYPNQTGEADATRYKVRLTYEA